MNSKRALSPSNNSICIVITCWNQIEKTMLCLASIMIQDCQNFDVVVVDNGSTDETVARISADYPNINLVHLSENSGPTRGFNVGIQYALDGSYPYIFLLNNDTTLAPNCIKALLNEMLTADDIGIVMPKIYYLDDPQRIWSLGNRHNPVNLEVRQLANNQLDIGQWNNAIDLENVPFCAVVFRREVFEEIGLLDEDYFLYYEDMDFCLRIRKYGYRIRLAPDAHVWHAVAASSGGDESPAVRYWKARSSVLYFRKNAKGLQWLAVIPWRTASAIRIGIHLLLTRQTSTFKSHIRGLRDGIKKIPDSN